MMRVIITPFSTSQYYECLKMYEYNKPKVKDNATFDEVLENTMFYAFYDNDNLSLCVYFYTLDDKLWINGYGIRKNHLFNKNCFLKSLTWFNCDVWAKTVEKPVVWALLRCGFEKYSDGIYVFRQNRDTN